MEKQLQQLLLRVKVPSTQVRAEVFREQLAKHLTLPAAFFHRDGETKKTLNTLPMIRTVDGSDWVGLLGTGEAGTTMLREALPSIMLAMPKLIGGTGIAPINLEEHQLGTSLHHGIQKYRLRRCLIRGEKGKNVEAHLSDILVRGIVRQAEEAGLLGYLPSNEDWRPHIEITRTRGLRIKVSDVGQTNEFGTLVDAELAMPLKLSGIWHVGRMTSRGHGRLIAINYESRLPQLGQGAFE